MLPFCITRTHRPPRALRQQLLPTAAAALTVFMACGAVPAHADEVAYLVNVTVRPGYNFPNAETALSYGHGICDRVTAGRPYPALVSDVSADFGTTDDYQAAYLINQAVNELCPQLIWQLRQSAAGYRPTAK